MSETPNHTQIPTQVRHERPPSANLSNERPGRRAQRKQTAAMSFGAVDEATDLKNIAAANNEMTKEAVANDVETGQVDAAHGGLVGKGANGEEFTWTKEEEKKVLRRVDLAIVSIVCVVFELGDVENGGSREWRNVRAAMKSGSLRQPSPSLTAFSFHADSLDDFHL